MHEAVSYADALKWVTDLYPWLRMKLFILIDSDRKQWTIKDLSAYVESSDHMIRRDLARLSKAGSITERSAMWEQGKPKQYTVMVAEVAAAVEAVPSPPPYRLWDDPRTYATWAGEEVWDAWRAKWGQDEEKWPPVGGFVEKQDG